MRLLAFLRRSVRKVRSPSRTGQLAAQIRRLGDRIVSPYFSGVYGSYGEVPVRAPIRSTACRGLRLRKAKCWNYVVGLGRRDNMVRSTGALQDCRFRWRSRRQLRASIFRSITDMSQFDGGRGPCHCVIRFGPVGARTYYLFELPVW